MTLEEIVPFVDYTSLGEQETEEKIGQFIDSALTLEKTHRSVAGVCTFSVYTDNLIQSLKNSSIQSVIVVGGFPHSQIPLEIKLAEIQLAVDKGIDEIDIVISQHLLHNNKLEALRNELEVIKKAINNKTLKVILETGNINDLDLLRLCTKICCEIGVDFVKTSTGKVEEGATPEKFKIICEEIKKYELQSGRKVGVKASGGIRTIEDASLYYSIVKDTLGEAYLSSKYFRIGASSLLKSLF